MIHYAAYNNCSIYAVADSPENAVATAREDVGDPDAEFSIALISTELADWIADNGWDGMNRSFEVGQDGYIVDTTMWDGRR